MSSTQFTVYGKLSGAEYVFQTHSLSCTTNGNYPCFAAALFQDNKDCRDSATVYSFALMKCRVFNVSPSTFIHAFRVILVTRSLHWVGCIGVAEYKEAPNYENIDLVLNVEKSFSLIPASQRFVFYNENAWKQCTIPSNWNEQENEKENYEQEESRASLKETTNGSSKVARIIGFELPSSPSFTENTSISSSSSTKPRESENHRIPMPVKSLRFPAPMDDLWLSDFFPLQIEGENDSVNWKEVDSEVFKQRFWYLYKSEKFPNRVFPSIFHRFVFELFETRTPPKSNTEAFGEKEEWIAQVFQNGEVFHGVAFARQCLQESTKQEIMKEWSQQSASRNSLLTKLRFERFDFFFDRLGRPILELIPWGQYQSTWNFVAPVLENTLRECFVWYCVDHVLANSSPGCNYLHVRHAIRLYEEWDIQLLREFAQSSNCSSAKELKFWKEYQSIFLEEPALQQLSFEKQEPTGDWIYDDFLPKLATCKMLQLRSEKETIWWLSALNKHDQNLRSLRLAIKRTMVRDIIRGGIILHDYITLVEKKEN